MTASIARRQLIAGLSLVLAAAGCASTEVAAPILDRSPRPVVAARPPATSAAPPPEEKPVVAVPSKPAEPAPQPASAKPVEHAAQPPAARPAEPAIVARPAQPMIRPYREGDWRPEYHVVKKGDTLYSIALDYGQDYRDLAAWNRLADPSYIQIGQQLRLFSPGGSNEAVALEPVDLPPASLTVETAKPAAAARTVAVFSEPKAQRFEYSDQALAQLLNPSPAKPAAPSPTKPAAASPAAATPPVAARPAPAEPPKTVQVGIAGLPDERLNWEWPTTGKLTYAFGEGANQKGVGLDGKIGQPVVASAPGKVVYSGSGLRGYGKLIIIKHNPTYLSVYAHNSQLLVKEGQAVAQGQKIAEMGDTDSDRVGLHFEIRRLGKPTDPLKYLPEKPS